MILLIRQIQKTKNQQNLQNQRDKYSLILHLYFKN